MATTNNPSRTARRTWRILVGLLVALAGTYWIGRQLGLANGELLDFLIASVAMVAVSGLVALVLFGAIRLLRR